MRRTFIVAHWSLTLPLAPFTLQAIDSLSGTNPNEMTTLLEVYPIVLLFSIPFSLPTLLVYLLCFYFLSKYDVKWKVAKLVLIVVSVIGITATFRLLDEGWMPYILIPYSVTTVVVGLIIRLKSSHSKPENPDML
jgi:glucan phosphoethanolaminetransferase (alkaline phosphatase superfamily)